VRARRVSAISARSSGEKVMRTVKLIMDWEVPPG
jgi:hypothetical protein